MNHVERALNLWRFWQFESISVTPDANVITFRTPAHPGVIAVMACKPSGPEVYYLNEGIVRTVIKDL